MSILRYLGFDRPSAETLFDQGMGFYQQGLEQEKLKQFKKAADLKQKAFKQFKEAADLGLSEAIFNAALMYKLGDGVEKDRERAFSLFEKASKLGNLSAKCNMAYMYSMGDGVPKNEAQAIKLYKEAESSGHIAALYSLGCIFYVSNKVKALQFLTKFVATQYPEGMPQALYLVGQIYETGSDGNDPNLPLAIELYRRGASLKDPGCIASLKRLGLSSSASSSAS